MKIPFIGRNPDPRRCTKVSDNMFRCEVPIKTKDGENIVGTVDMMVNPDGTLSPLSEDCESEEICSDLKSYMSRNMKLKRSVGER
jgi:hypothetical protein